MVHGDDKALVLPPKVASLQVIVIPDDDTIAVLDACSKAVNTLTEAGLRVEADVRDDYSPDWKYSHWELKGVPLRIEIGPKDVCAFFLFLITSPKGLEGGLNIPFACICL